MGSANSDDVDRTRTIHRSEESQFKDTATAAVQPGPQRGDRIGRYVVEEVIGTGGMGVVVAALDPELERQIALKVVRRDLGDRAFRQRLVREARSMARLEHDNVVRIYDAGEHDGEVFVAMELVRGETVGEWLRHGPRRWRDVLARFVPAGRGLAAAHAAGMVHRDFKPDNVLVRAVDGRVCVTDFGLAVPLSGSEPEAGTAAAAPTAPASPADARAGSAPGVATLAIDPTVDMRGRGGSGSSGRAVASGPPAADAGLTRTGTVVGTPPYMAPEQRRGEELDARADVFSFCVSLYEGLYGERPFTVTPEGDRASAWARAIEAGQVRPPPRGRRVPASLRRALLRGLATDAGQRWPDMNALLDVLARRRGRWRRFAVAAVALAAVAGVVGYLAIAGSDEAAAPPDSYIEGIRRLRQDDFRGAAEALDRAVAERPDFAAGWIALARARMSQPDRVHAKAAINKALPLIAPGDRAHQLEAEGLAADLDEKLDIAIDRYQALVRFFPADVDASLALAEVQTFGGHPKEALDTLHSLPSSADDGRVSLGEATAAMNLVDWPRTKAAATRAIALGERFGALEIVARAKLRRGLAVAKLGDRTSGLADLEAAGAIIRQVGDLGLESRQRNMQMQVLREGGDLAGALRASEEAVAIDRKVGESHNLAADLINTANVLADMSEFDRAGVLYQEAFTILRGLDDRVLLTHALYNYGELMIDLGNRTEAGKALREAITAARAASQEDMLTFALGALATTNFGLGLIKEAEAEWRESGTIAERRGDRDTVVNAYSGAAIVLAAQGDNRGALRASQQALQIAEALDPTSLATERGWHALILDDAGEYAQAAALAVPAAETLRDNKFDREAMIAHAAAAFALAQLGRRAEAVAQLARGRATLALPVAVDYRVRAASYLMRAAVKLGARDEARAIYAAAPRDRGALPWVAELEAQAKQLGVTH